MSLSINRRSTPATMTELKKSISDTNIQLSNYIIDEENTRMTLLEIFNNTLETNCFTFTRFDQRESNTYANNPKLLCMDVYDMPELFFIIMRANNLPHTGDFEPKKLERGILLLNTTGIQKLRDLYVFYKTKLYRDGDFQWTRT